MLKILLLITLFLLSAFSVFSQGPDPSSTFNQITITRSYGRSANATFNWEISTDFTQLSRTAGPNWTSVRDTNPGNCEYGKPLEIYDYAGLKSFGGSDPRGSGTVNGVLYSQLWYSGGIEVRGSTNVPYMFSYYNRRKKYLQFPVTLYFGVQAFPTFEAYRNGPPVLSVSRTVNATANVEIRSGDPFLYTCPKPRCQVCSIQSVTYSWDNTQTANTEQEAQESIFDFEKLKVYRTETYLNLASPELFD